MKDRTPTEFETRVMRRIKCYGDLYGGDKMVHWVNGARRLEKLGYLGKSTRWYFTDKGERWMKAHPQSGLYNVAVFCNDIKHFDMWIMRKDVRSDLVEEVRRGYLRTTKGHVFRAITMKNSRESVEGIQWHHMIDISFYDRHATGYDNLSKAMDVVNFSIQRIKRGKS